MQIAFITGGASLIGSHRPAAGLLDIRKPDNLSPQVRSHSRIRPEHWRSDFEQTGVHFCTPDPIHHSQKDEQAVFHFGTRVEDGQNLFSERSMIHPDSGDALLLALYLMARSAARYRPGEQYLQHNSFDCTGSHRLNAAHTAFRSKRTTSRQGDQRYFVSDTTLFQKATGWKPLVFLEQI